MREFKFRAWDKKLKEMRQVQLMDWSDWWVSTGHTWERENGLEYGERNSFKNEETDRHIIMQYTGLKDSQGTEIYDGDIVEIGNLHSYSGLYEVVFKDFGWKLKEDKYVCVPLENRLSGIKSCGVVIGNIYENTDIIKR